MSFVEEAKQVLSKKVAQPQPSEETTKKYEGADMFDLPPGSAPLVEDTEAAEPAQEMATVEEPTEETQVSDEPKKGKIAIAGQEFDTPEEALAYAKALFQKEADKQSVDDKENKPDEITELFKNLGDELFVNPEKALMQLFEFAVTAAEQKVKTGQQKETAEKELWSGFYRSNPELQESRDLVDYVLHRRWDELKDMSANEALAKVAEETRKLLRMSKQATIPTKELSNKDTKFTSATGQQISAPRQEVSKAALDFVSQVNKYRKKGLPGQ